MHEQMDSPQPAELRQQRVHLSHQSSHTAEAPRAEELILNERRNQIKGRLYEEPSSKGGRVLWIEGTSFKQLFWCSESFY